MLPIESGYRTQLIQEDRLREAEMERRTARSAFPARRGRLRRFASLRLPQGRRMRRASSPNVDCYKVT
jgi:hypothetical protein